MIKENFDADADAEVVLPSAYSYGGFVQVRVAKPMERDAPTAVTPEMDLVADTQDPAVLATNKPSSEDA
ncbi:MAG: hypothetical protein AB7S74_11645 [Hyphomicrobium sp.]